MKCDIPDELAYFIFGATVHHILSKINIHNVCYSLSKREEVVDVMGDTIGYVNNRGDLIGY